jgi:predicted Co/Zn/Cd cation transporter (cation efflux family)
MSSSDAIATGIFATLGIALGLVVAAFTVAFFGVYICVAVILFTDAENNPQFITTLLAFWCILYMAD